MKQLVSGSYSVGYLVGHPQTREIVLRHLKPLMLGEEQLRSVDGTLRGMFETNMGGGIPYEIIVPLMDELDAIPMPLDKNN